MIDIAPDGVAFDITTPIAEGADFTLLNRLPSARRRLRTVQLPVEIRDTTVQRDAMFRIGCQLVDVNRETHERLVEFRVGSRVGSWVGRPYPRHPSSRRARWNRPADARLD